MNTWDASSRADAAWCAALLGTAPRWWWLVALLTIIWVPLTWASALDWTWALALGLWSGVTWLTMRCELDARVFGALAREPGIWQTPGELDASLKRVLGVKRGVTAALPPALDMASRIAGALRLFRLLVVLACCQAAAVATLWLWHVGF
jgi:hypothetical protein